MTEFDYWYIGIATLIIVLFIIKMGYKILKEGRQALKKITDTARLEYQIEILKKVQKCCMEKVVYHMEMKDRFSAGQIIQEEINSLKNQIIE